MAIILTGTWICTLEHVQFLRKYVKININKMLSVKRARATHADLSEDGANCPKKANLNLFFG